MPPAPVPPEDPPIGFCHSHRTAVPFVVQFVGYVYTGKAKDLVLVVLPSDLSERLPEYAMGPE